MKKYTTLTKELNELSMERQQEIEVRAAQIRLEELTLRHLREKLGLSQVDKLPYLMTGGSAAI